jgi:hypothetical protein
MIGKDRVVSLFIDFSESGTADCGISYSVVFPVEKRQLVGEAYDHVLFMARRGDLGVGNYIKLSKFERLVSDCIDLEVSGCINDSTSDEIKGKVGVFLRRVAYEISKRQTLK